MLVAEKLRQKGFGGLRIQVFSVLASSSGVVRLPGSSNCGSADSKQFKTHGYRFIPIS